MLMLLIIIYIYICHVYIYIYRLFRPQHEDISSDIAHHNHGGARWAYPASRCNQRAWIWAAWHIYIYQYLLRYIYIYTYAHAEIFFHSNFRTFNVSQGNACLQETTCCLQPRVVLVGELRSYIYIYKYIVMEQGDF